MEPQEVFSAMMEGKTVILTDDAFDKLKLKIINKFQVYQIEQDSCNLINLHTDEIFYDVNFEDVIELSES